MAFFPFDSFTNSHMEFLWREFTSLSITPFQSSATYLSLSINSRNIFFNNGERVCHMSVNLQAFWCLLVVLTTIESCYCSSTCISLTSYVPISSIATMFLSSSFKVGVSNSNYCMALLWLLSLWYHILVLQHEWLIKGNNCYRLFF